MLDAISDFLGTYLRGGWLALLDIVLVAIIIYWVFILIRGTRAVRIVLGLSILYLVYLVADAVNLQLLSALLQTGAVVGLFAIVVVFQPELRRALEQIGRVGSFNRFFVSSDVSSAERVARETSRAARLLAGSRHGALIVIERGTGLQEDLATDYRCAAARGPAGRAAGHHLLPRHCAPRRGGNHLRREDRQPPRWCCRSLRTSCDSERYGTRHRAAIGISEQSDALVVVVSERRLDQPGRARPDRAQSDRGAAASPDLLNLIRPQAPRQRVPVLRRSVEGAWQVRPTPAGAPIDPEASASGRPDGTSRRRPAARGRIGTGPSICPRRGCNAGARADRAVDRLLTRNWHLKLAALGWRPSCTPASSSVGSFPPDELFPGLQIEAINQPSSTYPLTQQYGTVDVHVPAAPRAGRRSRPTPVRGHRRPGRVRHGALSGAPIPAGAGRSSLEQGVEGSSSSRPRCRWRSTACPSAKCPSWWRRAICRRAWPPARRATSHEEVTASGRAEPARARGPRRRPGPDLRLRHRRPPAGRCRWCRSTSTGREVESGGAGAGHHPGRDRRARGRDEQDGADPPDRPAGSGDGLSGSAR